MLLPDSSFKHERFALKKVDVSNLVSVQEAAAEIKSKYGVPSLLVNNAGVTRDSLFHKMTTEQIELTINVNLLGTMYPSQVVGGLMRDEASAAAKSGQKPAYRRIVMISSVAGLFGNVGQANYAATKAAVVGFAKSLAKEWGRYNISVSAVAPGMMNTDMVKTIPPEVMQSFVSRTPLGRMGEPAELAAFIAFLAREESAFITGDVIAFSGGLLL